MLGKILAKQRLWGLLLLPVLIGCGSDNVHTDGGDGNGSTESRVESTEEPNATGDQYVLNYGEVSEVMGVPITHAILRNAEPAPGFTQTSTLYFKTPADEERVVMVSVTEGEDVARYFQELSDVGRNQTIAGLGDKAVSYPRGKGHIMVLAGNYVIDVWGSAPGQDEKLRTIAEKTVTKMK